MKGLPNCPTSGSNAISGGESGGVLSAFHFAPPEARERLDRDGLIPDQVLFDELLDPHDPPAWFREQSEVERALEVENLRPVHLFLLPTERTQEAVAALMAQRGNDVREVDILPWLHTQELATRVEKGAAQRDASATLTPQVMVMALFGRGMAFKGLPPGKRILASREEILRALAILNVEARQSLGPPTADHVVEILLFHPQPRHISFTHRTIREIPPQEAQRLCHAIARENPQELITGRLTRRWWWHFLIATGVAAGSVLLAFFPIGHLAREWAWVGAAVAGVIAWGLWQDDQERHFLGRIGQTIVLYLAEKAWSIPLEVIRSTLPLSAPFSTLKRPFLRIGLHGRADMEIPIDHCGIPGHDIHHFVLRYLPGFNGWADQEWTEADRKQVPLLIFLPPLAKGTDWLHGDNLRVAEIRCFNHTGVPWVVEVRTHIRDADDRDASRPHCTGPSVGAFIAPGRWHILQPFAGWPPKEGRRIWFNISMMNNQTRVPMFKFDYDLEAGDLHPITLPDGQQGWTMTPTRARVNWDRTHVEDPRRPPDLAFPPQPDPEFRQTWAVLVMQPSTREEYAVEGFPSLEQATEYARRFVRDSVEEFRHPGMSERELREQWFLFGEDALVLNGDYAGSQELDLFITTPATPEDRDWQACQPDRSGAKTAWTETMRTIDEYHAVVVGGVPDAPTLTLHPLSRIIDSLFPGEVPWGEAVLTLVVGPICSGKTTFRHHQLEKSLVQLDAGEIYLQLNNGSGSGFGKRFEPHLAWIGKQAMARVLRERHSLAVELDLAQFAEPAAFIAGFKRLGWQVVVHDFDCAVETALKRNEAREKNNISSHFTTLWHLRWLREALEQEGVT
ncbi:MAG: ATP-binding protein [Magnetococcus sp. DMHC-1]